MSWPAILVLALGSYGCKLFGVAVLGRLARPDDSAEPGWPTAMANLIPAALFAALVAVQTFDVDGSIRIDARAVGVAVAAVAVWRRLPFVLVVVLAMATTALIRWQTS